jgi:hypothetical protein
MAFSNLNAGEHRKFDTNAHDLRTYNLHVTSTSLPDSSDPVSSHAAACNHVLRELYLGITISQLLTAPSILTL